MTSRRAHTRIVRTLIATLLSAAAIAGCSTTDTAEVPTDVSTAPPQTTTATTLPPAVTTTTPVPDTTAAPDTTPAPKRQTFSDDGPFDAGPYRATQTFGPRFGIDLELPVDGLYGFDWDGNLAITLDAMGMQTMLTVFHLDESVMMPPVLDASQTESMDYLLSVSSPIPDDVLAWFAERPGVSPRGPAETVELGGREGRRQTFQFGAFDEGEPCIPDLDRICHPYLYQPVSGYFFFQFVGDVITVYQLTVGPNRVAIVVDESAEPELAATITESLEFLEY
jgi:hypothetical protein